MGRGWKVVAAILIWLVLMWALLVGTLQEENGLGPSLDRPNALAA